MTRKQIMDNPAFRIAIIDVTLKTTTIAAKFNMSPERVRQLRRKYGRPVSYRLPHGWVSSGKWRQFSEWVSDIRTMHHKEVIAKYGWSETTVSRMRAQLGIGGRRVVKTKEFKAAVKTRLATEVAAIFGVSMSAVAIARRQMKVTRVYGKYERLNDAQFARDIETLPTRVLMGMYNMSKTAVHYYRKGLEKRNADSESKRVAKKGRRMPGRRSLDN
jgi:ribosomal protein L23